MKKFTREERYRVLKSPDEIKELHEKASQSIYRQKFHIQSVTGLLNDPNGFVYHDHKWHLFYQWCPWGAVHGLKYWYQTVSEDLIHWRNAGVCIKPDTFYDNKGAYSGSALVTDQSIYLYYTGNHRDENWQRTSYTCLVNMRDDGSIHKYSKPLFKASPDYTEHQRDPKIIYRKEDQTYYIILGAQNKRKQGRIIIYKSKYHNKDFTFAGELKVPGYEEFGDMWECPSIEHIGDADILIFCPQHVLIPGRGQGIHHNGYIIGEMDWEHLTFTPSGQFHTLDFGFDSYAAECAANLSSDRAILVAWMGLPDAHYPTDEEEWSGCLTMPRELTVHNRRLIQKPLPEFASLRDREADLSDGVLPRSCEIEIRSQGNIEIRLFSSETTPGFVIHYSDQDQMMMINRSGMKKRFNTQWGQVRTHDLAHPLHHLRIFIDSSSIEVYVNNGDALFTSRVFPEADEHQFSIKGEADAKIWTLKDAVKDDFVV